MPRQFSLRAWSPSTVVKPNLSSLFSSVLALFALLWPPLVIANKENRAEGKCNVTDGREVFAVMGLCWTRQRAGSSTMSAQPVYKQTGQ